MSVEDLFVFPAQAGVILTELQGDVGGLRFPRASGGDPRLLFPNRVRVWFSPRKRG